MGKQKLNQDGQPLVAAFNRERNVAKALESMYGVLTGIISDKTLTNEEILFLDVWLKEQSYLRDDPDVIDLVYAIEDILADGKISHAERHELMDLIKNILAYRDDFVFFPEETKSQINIGLGVINGITADDALTDGEIKFLQQWIKDSHDLQSQWPFSNVFKVVKKALQDGVITKAERTEILNTLEDIVGGNIREDGSAIGKTTKLPFNDVEYIEFEGRHFCFTGKLLFGSRKQCEMEAKIRGGIIHKNVTRNLDYLVTGPIASRDWIYTSYGRKIEKAIKNGSTIISEEVWRRSLDLHRP